MRKQIFLAALCLIPALIPARGQELKGILLGPTNANLGAAAKIEVPEGYVLMDGDTSRKRLKAIGEPSSDKIVGWLMPTNADWSVMFEFDSVGYVKDDDKDKLDADKLLASIRAGTEQANSSARVPASRA